MIVSDLEKFKQYLLHLIDKGNFTYDGGNDYQILSDKYNSYFYEFYLESKKRLSYRKLYTNEYADKQKNAYFKLVDNDEFCEEITNYIENKDILSEIIDNCINNNDIKLFSKLIDIDFSLIEIDDIKDHVIHMGSEENALLFWERISELGFEWSGDNKYKSTGVIYYKEYGDETCYTLYSDMTVKYSRKNIENNQEVLSLNELFYNIKKRIENPTQKENKIKSLNLELS